MFKRKIVKVKDNRFLEELERFLPVSIEYSESKKFTPQELHALYYDFGDYKVNLSQSGIIKKIKMNDLRHYANHYIIASNDGFHSEFCTLSDTEDFLGLLTQRLILISRDVDDNINSIKIYLPSNHDTTLYVDSDDTLYNHILSGEWIDFYLLDGEKSLDLKMDKKEILAFTKLKIKNSTIVLRYAP